ncbi:transcription factor Ouib [Drosophila grimshawi]|uniref:GH23243 n=1 Tax=Drosophila grimshawi TaxID=7222 RepID=B4JSZ0_DROGR|nr:transcription factor Ouib [Drosophila grimshawi]XP_032596123.1 transcription factor Ouib [Drosophila grimshawi]EDV94880.1 GH23243 [Drosophila grimshawi]
MATTELVMDIATVCRICLQDSDTHMVSIYERDEEQRGVSICEKIENCSGIKIVRTTELPTRICLKCRAFLTLAHKFRQICRHSDDFLREYICKELADDDDDEEEEEQQQLLKEAQPARKYEKPEVEVLEDGIWSYDELIEQVPAVDVTEVTTSLMAVPADDAIATPIVGGKPHVCNICGNSYPRKSTLDTHMRRHNNERPYECEICHKSFHVNYQLMRHIRQHTGARPYSCENCQRSFTDRTSLVKHERTHRNERPYACGTCGKSFTYANVLKVHYKTHTGEKPHTCRLCNKSFARNHNLIAHLQTQQHINDPRTAAYLHTLKAVSAGSGVASKISNC